MPWNLPANCLARAIEAKRAAGAALIDLTISNPTAALSVYPHEAIRHAHAEIEEFTYAPDPLGQERARIAICESYAQRGIAVSPDQLVLAASTSEAYGLLFKLFCDAGEEVLAPVPSYPLFEYLAALESVRIVPYRLRYDGAWFPDFADLRQRISSAARAIVIVNPNNPTGSFLKRHELELLIEVARQSNLPVISDEVFMDYPLGIGHARVQTLIGADSFLSFSLNGLSKMAGMPQMKLGWIVINGPREDRETARQRLELISDTYLSVGIPVQNALPRLLSIGEEIAAQLAGRMQRNLESLRQILKNSAAHPLHAEGGWSAIVQLPNRLSEEEWIGRLLEEQNVIVQPGFFFDMDMQPCVVISLIAPPAQFDEGVRRFRLLADGSFKS